MRAVDALGSLIVRRPLLGLVVLAVLGALTAGLGQLIIEAVRP